MEMNPTAAQISIANLCEEAIYILIVPFKEWDWGERGFSLNTSTHKSYINSLSSLIAKLRVDPMSEINQSMEDEHTFNNVKELKQEIVRFLNKEAIVIPSGQLKKITNKGNNTLRTFAMSGWGSLFGVFDLTLCIISATLGRLAVIKTNYHDSWVVEYNEIGKAKTSSLWEIDRNSETYQF